MTPDHARKVNLSATFLRTYFATDGGGLVPNDAEVVDLTDGNFLLADAVTGMLANVRGQSFDEVLDQLPERDEQVPADDAATPMWATTIDQMKFVHGTGGRPKPEASSAYDLPTAFRSSFNLAVALVVEFAGQAGQQPTDVATMLAGGAAGEM